ncbi:MAG: DUF72 domain-containing protein [Rhodothermales bacterium]
MSEELNIATRRTRISQYDFREFAPHIHFGTASDRYAGWIGQIYPETLRSEIQNRSKRLGGKTYTERLVPVASVRHYFRHFDVLELDFPFYRPLLSSEGDPSPSFFVLEQYAEHAPPAARFIVKAPQTFFARKLRRRSTGGAPAYIENPDFLNAAAYRQQFHEPALAILGDRLTGILFEQEYQKVSESPSPGDNVAELEAFFGKWPGRVQAHIELRSEHLLTPLYFDWLAERGIGFVFSHWTWLPPIRRQWELCGGRFTARNGEAVIRLLTPLNVRYADAYANSFPFERAKPSISESDMGKRMVLDTTALAFQAGAQKALLNIICNNRAWGNAPMLAQTIAERILREEQRRKQT